MSKRPNHNSFLLLTTLGVYIGLVLVGAPSGVLAYPAATTRNFDISEEIEFTENFDNDPDTAEEPQTLLGKLAVELGQFSAGGHFDLDFAAVEPGAQLQFSFGNINIGLGHGLIEAPNPHFERDQTTDTHHSEYDRITSKADNISLNLGTHLARSDLDDISRRA